MELGFRLCHYTRGFWAGSPGGRRSRIPSALSTCWARRLPRVTSRLLSPCGNSRSSNCTVASAPSASWAGPAASGGRGGRRRTRFPASAPARARSRARTGGWRPAPARDRPAAFGLAGEVLRGGRECLRGPVAGRPGGGLRGVPRRGPVRGRRAARSRPSGGGERAAGRGRPTGR